MKSAKLAVLRPVRYITSIPDAIAAATFILTGEARNGMSVNVVSFNDFVFVERGHISWTWYVAGSKLKRKEETFWSTLYEISKTSSDRAIDFSQYKIVSSEPLREQYDSRKGHASKTQQPQEESRRQKGQRS